MRKLAVVLVGMIVAASFAASAASLHVDAGVLQTWSFQVDICAEDPGLCLEPAAEDEDVGLVQDAEVTEASFAAERETEDEGQRSNTDTDTQPSERSALESVGTEADGDLPDPQSFDPDDDTADDTHTDHDGGPIVDASPLAMEGES